MYSVELPPGYRRNGPPARPKPDPFIPLINQILEEDKSRLKKQRHTSKRIYERLRDEHGFTGGITIVTDYVREKKRRTQVNTPTFTDYDGSSPRVRGTGHALGPTTFFRRFIPACAGNSDRVYCGSC